MSEPAYAAMPDTTASDDGEFTRLLREQGRPMRRMVERVSGSLDPDEVQQEFLLRAFKHRDRVVAFPDDDRCRWSWTVARNIAAKLHRTTWDVDLVADVPDDAAVAPDVLDLHVADENSRQLTSALDSLTPDDRHLVVERAVHGTPYAVLAEQLKSTEAALRWRYARLCERLRLTLTQAVLAIVPARWVFRPARHPDLARANGFAVALSTVMVGVLAFTVGLPAGGGPLNTPRAEAAGPLEVSTPPAPSVPSVGSRAPSRLPKRAAAHPTRGGAKPPSNPPRERGLAKTKTRVCVGDHCVSSPGDPDDPGDEVYVDAPYPVGRNGVKQDEVPVCDTMPTVGPAGCERHG